MIMFEVNFSEQSMRELNRLDPFMQMTLVEKLSGVRQQQLEHQEMSLGVSSGVAALTTVFARVNLEFTLKRAISRCMHTTSYRKIR